MTDLDQDPRAAVTSAPDGRVTIPAQIRRAAGIEPGQTLVLYVENGRVVIEERQHMIERLQRATVEAFRAAGYDGTAADALIEERRSEARREDQL